MAVFIKNKLLKIALLQPRLSREKGEGNIEAIGRLIERNRRALKKSDICVLPECWFRSLNRQEYEREAREIQKKLKTVLVAGSHHETDGAHIYNRGVVLGKDGRVLARYGKRHPFDSEARHGVKAHRQIGEFKLGGARVAVMICADFFFSSTFECLKHQPDLIIVPAESVASSQNNPRYGQELWKHTAIARAYEVGSYIAICDWGLSRPARTCGATGFADPATEEPKDFYQVLGPQEGILFIACDISRLKKHRAMRRQMNFFGGNRKFLE